MKNNRICKNCKFWEAFKNNKTVGYCNNGKILKYNCYKKNKGDDQIFIIPYEHEGWVYVDYMYGNVVMGENFGCIHWQPKENNNDEKA